MWGQGIHRPLVGLSTHVGNLNPISPVRLNHAVLYVSELVRSEVFYRDVFGMDVVALEPRARAVFLRSPLSGNHHDLGLFEVGGAEPKRGGIGLYHLAWQVDTIDDLASARQTLMTAGRTPVNRVTAPPRACTAPTLTATSLKLCGCCRVTFGESASTPPPLSRSILPTRLSAGLVCQQRTQLPISSLSQTQIASSVITAASTKEDLFAG